MTQHIRDQFVEMKIEGSAFVVSNNHIPDKLCLSGKCANIFLAVEMVVKITDETNISWGLIDVLHDYDYISPYKEIQCFRKSVAN